MHDGAERVDGVALQQDVDLDEVGALLPRGFVVERGISARLRLEGVEEVEHDLRERQRVAHLDALLGQVVHAEQVAATGLAQLHDGADVLARHEDRRTHDGFGDVGDLALGELARVRHLADDAVVRRHPVDDVRQGRDEVEVELSLEAFTRDLQVQHAEEADAETEPERCRRLRFVDERRVVELQLVEGVTQDRVVGTVDRIQTREHHGLRVGVAADRLGRGIRGVRDRVTDLRLAHVLHAGDEVADLADGQALRRDRLGRVDADLEQLVRRARRHHLDLLARAEPAVDDAHVRDDAAVGVVDGVEDHGAGRRVGVTDGGRQLLDDDVEQFLDTDARLAGDLEYVLRFAADEAGDLRGVLLGLRGRQVDLVEYRDDREVVLHRQVQVGERLRLDALRGVDEQDGALARGERTRHLVGEVDVPRRVDHVEAVGRTVELPRHAHSLALDRDAALALDVHAVEVLRTHGPILDDARLAQHPVGERRLAVVDVRDDAEVADLLRRRRGGLECLAGHG